MTSLAIVGTAPSTRHEAPVDDPEVKIWSLNDAYQFLKRADLWFELHTREHFTGSARPPGHLEWLRNSPIPVMMWWRFEDIPASVPYPYMEMAGQFGEYFTSSIAYMLAFAVHQLGPGDTLSLYGVDLSADTEYVHQRSCVEYLLGYARAKGISIVLPDACPLLRGPLYGREDPERGRRAIQQVRIDQRLQLLLSQKTRANSELDQLRGRIDEATYMRALLSDR